MSGLKTRTGDFGQTDVKGQRVYKDSEIMNLIGDLDEAMAHFILAHNLKPEGMSGFEDKVKDLILISAIVAGYKEISEFPQTKITDLETEIEAASKNYTDFVYPFDDLFKAQMNVLRTVVRRAERQAHRVLRDEGFRTIKAYLNALSGVVFVYIG